MLVPEVNGLVAFLSRPHERAFYGGAHQEFCAIMRRLKKAFYPLMARPIYDIEFLSLPGHHIEGYWLGHADGFLLPVTFSCMSQP